MQEQIQAHLFDRIRTKIPLTQTMAEQLSELLGISKDSAYRRIKGEKPLLFEEIITLAKTFNISLDEIMNLEDGNVVFQGQYFNSEDFDLEHYLTAMIKNLETVSAFEQVELFYISKDIPVFYYLMFPEIAAFKFFVWTKTQMQFEAMREKKLSFDIVTDRLFELSQQAAQHYTRLPSVEILNADNILNDLRQLEYYKDTNMFANKGDLDIIYNKLDEMVTHMEEQAIAGRKFMKGEGNSHQSAYKLYVNDFFVGDNTVIAVANGVKRVFLNHAAINIISTANADFAEYNFEFMSNIIRKSTLISDVGERTRSRFFNLIHERIDRFRSHTIHSLSNS